MKLIKTKVNRTFVTSIKYTPKEFLDLLKGLAIEIDITIPNLIDEEGQISIDMGFDYVTWDGYDVVVTFKPGRNDPDGDYAAYCPEVK